jgi:hypothetical protein
MIHCPGEAQKNRTAQSLRERLFRYNPADATITVFKRVNAFKIGSRSRGIEAGFPKWTGDPYAIMRTAIALGPD